MQFTRASRAESLYFGYLITLTIIEILEIPVYMYNTNVSGGGGGGGS